MNGRKRNRAGFTLVELLVVVVIIGMLVALLIPAVQSARRTAIRGKCINYQRELGLAITAYESAKGSFPGYVVKARGVDASNTMKQVNVSWVVPIFAFLGRQDLWEPWRDGTAQYQSWKVLANQLACPADSEAVANSANPLSYVVNRNLFRIQPEAYANTQWWSPSPATPPTPWTRKMSMSDVKSQDTTVLLMEGYNPRLPSNSPILAPIDYARPRQPQDMNPDTTNLTFNWDWDFNVPPNAPRRILPDTQLPTTVGVIRKSAHSGGVVMAFCSGRVEFINDDADVNATTFSYGPVWQ